ncbi:MAG: Fn3-like domain-containing protein [Chitinophagales bacterium]
MKTLSQLFFAALFFVFAFGTQTSAQTFAVKPAKLQYPLEPEQSAYRQITVTNLTDKPQTYNITKGDFMPDEMGNTKRFAAGTTSRSCADWIQITPTTFELAPNESKKIRVSISVPKEIIATKWAELYIQQEEELTMLPALADKAMQSQLQAQGRIAVPILQSPNSNTDFEAIIKDLRESEKNKYHVDLVNSGDKLILGSIVRTLTNLETGLKKQLPELNIALLPDVTRTIEFPLPTKLDPGMYNLTAIWQLDYQKKPKGVRTQIEVK